MNLPQPCSPRGLIVLLAATAALGCAPVVDIAGVYFPAWLVSTIAGVAFSYAMVYWLGRRPSARGLAESGLLFVSLVAGSSLALWWALFSGF